MQIKKYIQTGKYHEEHGILCQDAVGQCEKEGKCAIVGCDGAGTAPYSHIGANELARQLATYLVVNEEQLCSKTESEIAQNIADFITESMESQSKNYNCDQKDLACTVMAVITNEKEHRWLSIHLGDGMILSRKHRQKNYNILSWPRNGVFRNQTYLTTTSDLKKHIRIMQGKIEDIDTFALISDGVYEYQPNILSICSKIDKISSGEAILASRDDQLIAVMCA